MSLSRFFPCFQSRLEDSINKLDYSNNILTEGFPHVWQYERTLEELNVISTRINCLPPQLFYCLSLKILLANNNNLETIPDAIGSLRQLQQLDLSRNCISNVPDNIKSCKSLTHLDLSCNSLQKLPNAITCLISLQELILNETYLEFLPANFGRLVNLRVVELRSNNLVSLPKSMQRLTNLQRLDIGCNEFNKVPEVIGELKQLRELWFDFNQIQSIPLQIGKLRELVHCEANGNCINYLPSDIDNWLNVEVFSVSMNNLTILPTSLGMFKSLVTLKCESNELNELPNCISKLENLEELVVSHNKLIFLPHTIGRLRKLRYLFADDNNLQKLPDDMCSCSVLTVVNVSRNQLYALPDNIGHLKNLKVLNIVQNNITALPVSLLSLVNLASLWISSNQSQPLIPMQYTEISKKTHLTCFMLPQLGSGPKSSDSINEFNAMESENLRQTKRHSDKTAACITSKRRICFAEKPTILQLASQIPQELHPRNGKNGNYFVLPNTNNGSKNSTAVLDPKYYLMRSPTPYPKELRLMAQYVQLNNQKFLTNINNHKDATPNLLQETTNNLLYDESNVSSSKYVSCQVGRTITNDEHNFLKCGATDARYQYYKQQMPSQTIEKGQYCGNLDNLPKPPPYLIARCFTKKSVEDLTKYEYARKLQEKYRLQRCNTDIESETLCNINDLGSQNESNSNNTKSNQNKLVIHQQKNDLNKYDIGYEKTPNVESVTIGRENKYLDLADNPEISNTFAKKKCYVSKKKWLFGVHKNPRVIQINVNWESCPDFEIDVLPNKEGIFVISVVYQSNAAQLIKPLDKILEVEGVDFTNISVNEARHVLKNSRPSISIMLSRK